MKGDGMTAPDLATCLRKLGGGFLVERRNEAAKLCADAANLLTRHQAERETLRAQIEEKLEEAQKALAVEKQREIDNNRYGDGAPYCRGRRDILVELLTLLAKGDQ